MEIEVQETLCPKCGHRQPRSEVCSHCGIVIDKFVRRRKQQLRPKSARQSGFPFRSVTRLLQLVCVLSLVLVVAGYWKKDQLPPADFYPQVALTDPVQTETTRRPFTIEANGIVYRIEPVADYTLRGVVVSYHDSDAFIDVYHHTDWKDFINIRDICVIWGENVASEVYRDMEFKNTTWTCWAYWPNGEVASRFRMPQLSNNHLLADDAQVQQAVMSAEPGDQIFLSGILASYSHSNGGFRRGTSTTRTDTGNGACETIFVDDFRIEKKANTGWRRLYFGAAILAIVSLIGLLTMVFLAPVRRY